MATLSLCTNPLTCGLGTVSLASNLDYANAGFNQMLNGQPQIPLGEQTLQNMGANKEAAALIYMGIGLVPAFTASTAAEYVANLVKHADSALVPMIGKMTGQIQNVGTKGRGELTGPLSAEVANAPHLAKGNFPPYAVGTVARDIILQNERVFVRVHGEGSQARSWMMRPQEIEGLTAQQIKDKFALPELPTFVSDVHVPAGTRIRVGTVAPQSMWGSGGATQYELLQRLPNSAFKNKRTLQ